MAGANIKSKGRLRLKQLFWKNMSRTGTNINRLGRPHKAKYPTFVAKAGVPATNTAADAPDRKFQICIDTTNNDVYICTAYTNSTTFTWLKISD